MNKDRQVFMQESKLVREYNFEHKHIRIMVVDPITLDVLEETETITQKQAISKYGDFEVLFSIVVDEPRVEGLIVARTAEINAQGVN